MFSLQNQSAKLISVNPRAEIHGTEHVMAADLKFSIKVSNDVLPEFQPSLYGKGDAAQGDLINEPGHLPTRKFPEMGVVKWGKMIQQNVEISLIEPVETALQEAA